MANILRPGRRGDGTQINRDLRDFLVGKTIKDVQFGAQTAEGYSTTRVVFDDGDQMLVIPVIAEPAVTAQTGVRAATLFMFQPKNQRRIITPGQFRG